MGDLVIIRHAESYFCKKSRYSGNLNIPLSSDGIKHAIKTAKIIPNIDYDLVYTSTLIRSLETALIILACSKIKKTPLNVTLNQINDYIGDIDFLPIIQDKCLDERDYGLLQNVDKNFIYTQYDMDTIYEWRRSLNKAPPGGESLAQVVERINKFVYGELLNRLSRNLNILIVAHQNSMRAIYFSLLRPTDKEIEKIEFANCSGFHLKFEDNSYTLIQNIGSTNNDIYTGDNVE